MSRKKYFETYFNFGNSCEAYKFFIDLINKGYKKVSFDLVTFAPNSPYETKYFVVKYDASSRG